METFICTQVQKHFYLQKNKTKRSFSLKIKLVMDEKNNVLVTMDVFGRTLNKKVLGKKKKIIIWAYMLQGICLWESFFHSKPEQPLLRGLGNSVQSLWVCCQKWKCYVPGLLDTNHEMQKIKWDSDRCKTRKGVIALHQTPPQSCSSLSKGGVHWKHTHRGVI